MAVSDFKDKKQPDYALGTESDDPDSINAITALVAAGGLSAVEARIGYIFN